MVKFGVSHTSIFESVWIIVEAVNNLPAMNIEYPSDDIGHCYTVILVTGILPLGNMFVLLSSPRPIPCRIGLGYEMIRVGIQYIQPNPLVIQCESHAKLK